MLVDANTMENEMDEQKLESKGGTGAILDAVLQIMDEIGSIGKGEKNQTLGYAFRGIDQVYQALQPLLIKMRVCLTCRILDMQREQRDARNGGSLQHSVITARYRMTCALDGSYIETDVVGEGMDSGDKASSKAMSIAYKYAMFQMLCIPLDTNDPDFESPEPAAKKPAAVSHNDDRRPVSQEPKPIDAAAARNYLMSLKGKQDDGALASTFKRLSSAPRLPNGEPEDAAISGVLDLFRQLMDENHSAKERVAELLRKVPECDAGKLKAMIAETEKLWNDGLIGKLQRTQIENVLEAAMKF